TKVVHGGTVKRAIEKRGGPVLDFSASLNPFPPDVKWTPDPGMLECYPDDSYLNLKEVIGKQFGRSVEEICVGNGSIELIRLFCAVVLQKGGTFFIEDPTFGEYALSARLYGGRQTYTHADALIRFICNPNNPTGTLHTRDNLCTILDAMPFPDALLFLDEAFIELSDPNQSLVNVRNDSLFVLRSLTKNFAVPGIRFGYGFGEPDLIAQIELVRPPWSVNAFAEAFAIAAFRNFDELDKSRTLICREREWLDRELTALGLTCTPSSANYILADAGRDAGHVSEQLLLRGVLVRNCSSFGLPTSIRLAVRDREENRILIEALAACLR
ncbi:histidinol-phosphate transaminase, partial [Methanoregula sp.]|uniref:pyridoxal phosphate-dependent aminotransferase n=1 Tax=Methanoregula sp. TaxID=2052170 RepID=UPI000CAF9D8F